MSWILAGEGGEGKAEKTWVEGEKKGRRGGGAGKEDKRNVREACGESLEGVSVGVDGGERHESEEAVKMGGEGREERGIVSVMGGV